MRYCQKHRIHSWDGCPECQEEAAIDYENQQENEMDARDMEYHTIYDEEE